MNRLREQLGKLIRSELIKETEIENDIEFLRVTEPQNQIKLKKDSEYKTKLLAEFKIKNDIPHEFVAFVLDPNNIEIGHELAKFKNFSWLIVENREDTERDCDIVIVINRYGSYKILLGELKSSGLSHKDLYGKFINSYYIVDYLVKLVGEYECGNKIFPKYFFVVFSTAKKLKKLVNKNSTYMRKVKSGEIEGNPLDKLPGKVVPFEVKNNELVSFNELWHYLNGV